MQLRTITIQIQIGFAHCRSTSINHHLFWSHWHCGLPGLCGCYSQSIDNMHATHTMPNMARKHISTYLANYIYIEREREGKRERQLPTSCNQMRINYIFTTTSAQVIREYALYPVLLLYPLPLLPTTITPATAPN